MISIRSDKYHYQLDDWQSLETAMASAVDVAHYCGTEKVIEDLEKTLEYIRKKIGERRAEYDGV